MEHRRCLLLRSPRVSVWAVWVALAAAPGCGADHQSSSEPGGVPESAFAEPPGSVRPGCTGQAEFVALGPVPSIGYLVSFGAADPDSNYLFWDAEWSGDAVDSNSYRWSSADGITVLATREQFDADHRDVNLGVSHVSSDGRSAFGLRLTESSPDGGFHWTAEQGISWLPFEPAAATADGNVAFGAQQNVPVLWTARSGVEVIDPALGPASPELLAARSAEVVVGTSVTGGSLWRWTPATGSQEIGLLAPRFSRISATALSANGDVITGSTLDPAADITRAFRWTQSGGLQDLGSRRSVTVGSRSIPTAISADGKVIVGYTQRSRDVSPHVFRWTEAAGMVDLVLDAIDPVVTYLSPRGDVVIGYADGKKGSLRGFRWTEAGGVQQVGYVAPQGIGADGDVLVGMDEAGPVLQTFGALAGKPLPLAELAPAGWVPEGWSSPSLVGISRDARMLFGTAGDPDGNTEPWLLRLRETCPLPE